MSKSKEYILSGSVVPFFGAMRLDEIDQTHVNAFVAMQAVATKTVNNRLSVLATMLRYAGPSGCKLIPETKLRFHVKAMSPDIVVVPIAEVGKLIAAATDERYQVAVLLGLRIGEIRGLQWGDLKHGQLTVHGVRGPGGAGAGDQGADGALLDRHDHAVRDRDQLDAAIRQAFGRQVGDRSAETNNAESGFET